MGPNGSRELLFLNQYQSPSIGKILSIADSNDRQHKKSEFRDIDIRDIVHNSIDLSHVTFPGIMGLLLRGLSTIYAKKIEWFESRLISAMIHIETILQSGYESRTFSNTVHLSRSSRKRPLAPPQTPLEPVPENHSIIFHPSSLLDFPVLTDASNIRTPISSRKRFVVAPVDVSDEGVFDATPTINEADKRRRLSSISDVMDSLRADDGQRRLSGLLGSSSLDGLPPSPDMGGLDDHFDTGIDPPSPWTSMVETPSQIVMTPSVPAVHTPSRPRRSQKQKSLFDRPGKRGIEIDVSDIEARHKWYLKYSFYLKNSRFDNTARFTRDDIRNDLTSHYSWYVKPRETQQFMRKKSNLKKTDNIPDYLDYDNGNDYFDNEPDLPELYTPCPVKRPELSLADRVDGSGVCIPELIKNVSRIQAAKDFMSLLTLASTGVFSIARDTHLVTKVIN